MGFGSLRSIIRPVSRALLSTRPLSAFTPITSPANTISPVTELRRNLFSTFRPKLPWIPPSNAASVAAFHSLTDTRLPKRRPSYKPKRKRASLRPPGPYAWVKYTPGEPISPNNPNEGSVKRRNEKKRIAQRKAFILQMIESYLSCCGTSVGGQLNKVKNLLHERVSCCMSIIKAGNL
ncbi:uncharacterized protein LOC107870407 isoform X2 [Capsicum annuum]|uniref:uncharacterized protein LOC107870407 isoform X2 n=1 Tax=Capsicum annuum TaxID=4072 RepID=UPI001FB07DBE|nr:uncharacterized protein LOC107870407 isoform X2 [Capsicum annuum]